MGGVVFSWLGGSDVYNFNKKKQGGLFDIEDDKYELGPVERVLRQLDKLGIDGAVKVDCLHLLYAYDYQDKSNNGEIINQESKLTNEVKPFVEWLENKYDAQIRPIGVRLPDVTDYAAIYKSTHEIVGNLLKSNSGTAATDDTFIIHASSGTPQMTTIWIFLAKTKWPFIHLVQTSKEEGIKIVRIPFDLAISHNFYFDKKGSGAVEIEGLSTESLQKIKWRSPQMAEALQLASNIAKYDFNVLLEGESGTGKELFADLIHKSSHRKDKPFQVINCGAMPANLLESELFGHEKGAFTGANSSKEGLFEVCDGGTLFLDEIGDLPLELQVKILRVVDSHEQTFRKVGGEKEITVDVRIIAATNKKLTGMVSKQEFREDLFRRLAIGYIKIPSLRDRGGDLPLLIEHFVEKINKRELEQQGFKKRILSKEANDFLLRQVWSGNVRELAFTLERALLLYAGDSFVSLEHAKKAYLPIADSDTTILQRTLDENYNINDVEAELYLHYVKRAVRQCGYKKADIAKFIGVKPATFNKMLRDGKSDVYELIAKDRETAPLAQNKR